MTLGVLVGAWFFLVWVGGAIRTPVFGLELEMFIFLLVLFGVCSTVVSIAWLGTTKKAAGFSVAMTLSMVLVVEGYARAQEVLVSRANACPNPEGVQHVETRWWPYQNSGFFCLEDGRWVGHD
jgi:hypothetical protein